MDLSVIIINYNTKKLTSQTVEYVLKNTTEIDYEVLVVDNSSKQEERYQSSDSRVTVLSDVPNCGFGAACNLGVKQASGEYLLFLNSDTIVKEHAIDRAYRYCAADPEIGALGIRTHLEDGTFDAGCKRGFPTPSSALYYYMGLDKKHPESRKYGVYHQTFLPIDQTSEVDCVSGAFLMMPAALFKELNGFDEDFFMYGEDLDLCFRIKQAGKKIIYYSDAQMIHLKGSSGLSQKSKTVIYHFYYAMKLFYQKHYKKKYCFLVTWMVYFGIWAKYRLTLLKH